MKRILLIGSLLVLLVCVFIVPASAEEINYRDYEGNVKVDGDNDIVTVDLPTYWFTGLIAMPDGAGLQPWNGHSFSCTIGDDTNKLNIYLAPFGTEIGAYDRDYTGRYLSMDNIPSDAEFYLQFGVTTSSPNSFSVSSIQERVYSVNASHASLYSMNTYPGGEPGSFAVSTVFDAVDSQGWFPEYIMYLQSGGTTFAGTTISFVVYNFRLEVSISSLYRLQEETGRTNDLLTEVNKQLAEQGKTMDEIVNQQQQTNDKIDDIINYQPEVNTPEGGEVVGDLEDIEDSVMEDVNDGFSQAEDIQLSVFEILAQYVTAFGAVSYIFDLFAFMPFIRALLTISLGLGIVATLLNIGLSVSTGAERASRSAKNGANNKKGK